MIDRMSDDIKLIVSGHTHAAYLCNVDGKIVTSAASFGRVVTDIDMQLSRKTGKLVSATVNNQPVTRTVTPDPSMAALVNHYKVLIAPIANRVVGQITATLNRVASPVGETPLGDVIADAQLESTLAAGAQIALMNPGGVRTDLNFPGSPAGEGDGNVTYGEIFAVQPFTNILVTLTYTGAQIDAVLEQQWTAARTAVLQPSKTLQYKATLANTFGDRVSEITINGVPVNPAASYRVTVNNFLAGGGDSFPALTGGTNARGRRDRPRVVRGLHRGAQPDRAAGAGPHRPGLGGRRPPAPAARRGGRVDAAPSGVDDGRMRRGVIGVCVLAALLGPGAAARRSRAGDARRGRLRDGALADPSCRPTVGRAALRRALGRAPARRGDPRLHRR